MPRNKQILDEHLQGWVDGEEDQFGDDGDVAYDALDWNACAGIRLWLGHFQLIKWTNEEQVKSLAENVVLSVRTEKRKMKLKVKTSQKIYFISLISNCHSQENEITSVSNWTASKEAAIPKKIVS